MVVFTLSLGYGYLKAQKPKCHNKTCAFEQHPSMVMSVGGVLFLSCLLCWWSFLSVRRVVLKVGCVLTGFARARVNESGGG